MNGIIRIYKSRFVIQFTPGNFSGYINEIKDIIEPKDMILKYLKKDFYYELIDKESYSSYIKQEENRRKLVMKLGNRVFLNPIKLLKVPLSHNYLSIVLYCFSNEVRSLQDFFGIEKLPLFITLWSSYKKEDESLVIKNKLFSMGYV